ncbi:MAG: AMP-dependent synthetase/ligase [Solirubrobacteraceae bacterium]
MERANNTVCAAFQATAAANPDAVALRTKGGAIEITWGEYAERVRTIAGGLHRLGLRRGDTMALMLTNRPEFHLLDAAAMHLGAVPFSIYNTSSSEQAEFLLRDSGAKIGVVEPSFRDRMSIEHVIEVDLLDELEGDPDLDFDAAWQAVEPDDLLTLIYTSGTTGDPKGVQLTHRNMCFTMDAYDQVLRFPRGGRVVSYLPMAHVAERNCSHYFPMAFGFTVTCCPHAREVVSYLPEVRPSWFFAVPRIFEKLKASIESGGGPPEAAEELAALRESLGLDRIQALNVGAAPTPPEVIEFFHSIGLPLGELWGMSETNAIGACNPPDRIKIGTVGPAVPGVEIRLAGDGEVELRGDCVFAGYRGQEELTRETFTEDGWLKTGDIGALDEDGYLAIVDRKKELIINAAGKNMSPANIESTLKAASPLIGSVVVIGDRRPFNVALIVLDPDAAANADSPEDAIAEAVETANARLSNVEKIRRHKVLDAEWEPGGDELTPTMKLKRRPIAEKYAGEIEALYEREQG